MDYKRAPGMRPDYDVDKIKFATDPPTFTKADGLYEGGKVTQFKEGIRAFSAVVNTYTAVSSFG